MFAIFALPNKNCRFLSVLQVGRQGHNRICSLFIESSQDSTQSDSCSALLEMEKTKMPIRIFAV